MATLRPHLTARLAGYVFIIVGSTFAGSLGVFYHLIDQRYQASAETMVFLRACISLTVLVVAVLGWQRRLLRVDRHSVPWLIAFGVFGQAFFSWAYARSIMAVGVSVAALMGFTSLIWVSAYEWVALREKPGGRKLAAMAIAFAGVFLVMRVHRVGSVNLGPSAIAISVVAGIAGSLWTILNKQAGRRSSPPVVVGTGMIVSATLMGMTQGHGQVGRLLAQPGAVWWLLALAVGPALMGPLLWTAGLRRISASDASIVGAWEPVMACVLGFLVLGERLEAIQVLGALVIIASIVLLGAGRAPKGKPAAGGVGAPVGAP